MEGQQSPETASERPRAIWEVPADAGGAASRTPVFVTGGRLPVRLFTCAGLDVADGGDPSGRPSPVRPRTRPLRLPGFGGEGDEPFTCAQGWVSEAARVRQRIAEDVALVACGVATVDTASSERQLAEQPGGLCSLDIYRQLAEQLVEGPNWAPGHSPRSSSPPRVVLGREAKRLACGAAGSARHCSVPGTQRHMGRALDTAHKVYADVRSPKGVRVGAGRARSCRDGHRQTSVLRCASNKQNLEPCSASERGAAKAPRLGWQA